MPEKVGVGTGQRRLVHLPRDETRRHQHAQGWDEHHQQRRGQERVRADVLLNHCQRVVTSLSNP